MNNTKNWNIIDGELCKVINFTPLVSIEDRKVTHFDNQMPYAYVTLECKKLLQQEKGAIFHKVDFLNLWNVFKERGVSEDEEVLLFWSKKHYKWYAKIFSLFMPKLRVMVCKKSTFDLMSDPTLHPEITGEARTLATMPILDLKPKVME